MVANIKEKIDIFKNGFCVELHTGIALHYTTFIPLTYLHNILYIPSSIHLMLLISLNLMASRSHPMISQLLPSTDGGHFGKVRRVP